MEKENLSPQSGIPSVEEERYEDDMEICSKCKDEPVFMNGLCVYCYEEEFYEEDDFDDRHKELRMNIHGQSMTDPRQQEINRERFISKISKKKK